MQYAQLVAKLLELGYPTNFLTRPGEELSEYSQNVVEHGDGFTILSPTGRGEFFREQDDAGRPVFFTTEEDAYEFIWDGVLAESSVSTDWKQTDEDAAADRRRIEQETRAFLAKLNEKLD